MLGFVAQDQPNISADSLGVAIDKPFKEVLAPASLYICVLDRLHGKSPIIRSATYPRSLVVRAAPFRVKKAIACSRSYSAPFFLEVSQLRISNQVPIPEPIVANTRRLP